MLAPDFEVLDEPELGARFEKLGDERPNDPRLMKSTRRDFERLIRRNLDNAGLYEEELVFLRILPEDYDIFIGRIVPESETFDTGIY